MSFSGVKNWMIQSLCQPNLYHMMMFSKGFGPEVRGLSPSKVYKNFLQVILISLPSREKSV